MRLSDPKLAKEIIVWVALVAILIAIFAWSMKATAGGGDGDIKQKVADVAQVILEDPEQHTEQTAEDEDDAHEDHESHFSLLHFETQKVIAEVIGGIALVVAAGIGLKAARAKHKAKKAGK